MPSGRPAPMTMYRHCSGTRLEPASTWGTNVDYVDLGAASTFGELRQKYRAYLSQRLQSTGGCTPAILEELDLRSVGYFTVSHELAGPLIEKAKRLALIFRRLERTLLDGARSSLSEQHSHHDDLTEFETAVAVAGEPCTPVGSIRIDFLVEDGDRKSSRSIPTILAASTTCSSGWSFCNPLTACGDSPARRSTVCAAA